MMNKKYPIDSKFMEKLQMNRGENIKLFDFLHMRLLYEARAGGHYKIYNCRYALMCLHLRHTQYFYTIWHCDKKNRVYLYFETISVFMHIIIYTNKPWVFIKTLFLCCFYFKINDIDFLSNYNYF
jgi:hypothetical protein